MKASAMKKEEAQRGREAFWGRKTAGRGGGITGVASSVLAEGAVVFEIVGVRRAADDGLAGGAQGLGLGALAEGVVEDDNVGPLAVFFVVGGLGDETIGDIAFLLVFDEVADFVAFLDDLPGNVSDEAGERGKEEFLFFHEKGRGSVKRKGPDSIVDREMLQDV